MKNTQSLGQKSGNAPTQDQLGQLEGWYKKSLHYQAWKVVAQCQDYRTWPSGESRRWAAVLASRLGSRRWADVLDWRNWRAHPDHDKYFLHAQFARLGEGRWWEVFQDAEQRLEKGIEQVSERADVMALLGWLHGRWRDFERAFPLLEQAIALDEKRVWPWVEKAEVLQIRDRREEALEVIEHALELDSFYRPAVLIKIGLLQDLRKEEEAEAFLRLAHDKTEVPSYSAHLQALSIERQEWQEALDYLDEYEAMSPLLDKGGKEWLAGRRADIYLESGDVQRFFGEAEQTGKRSFQKRVAKHLRKTEGEEHRRKKLSVPFIRQHNMTCAPATLASIAAFWGKDHDHLEIADAICYDGTPWHKERQWAHEHGFVTREFKITRDAAKALIDRGVPFTLSTAWTTGAHLQACVGFDEFQDGLVIRDPTSRHSVEMSQEGLEKDNPVEGPRGMVLIPEEEAHLLDGLEFPDEKVYDAHHEFCRALEIHQRQAVERALEKMEEAGGEEHPMLWWCRQRLARYDRNSEEELIWLDRLIARFPKVERFKYWRLFVLQRLSQRSEREKSLRQIVGQRSCSTVFYSDLGELYAEDDRDYVMADYYLRKAMRLSPMEEVAYASLAHAKWRRFEREEATQLHRVASCLSGTFEPYAMSYFDASSLMGRREEGLAFLEQRVHELGEKQGGPWLSLIEGYARLARMPEAKEKLLEACRKLPENGELLLEAAERQNSWGETELAWQTMEKAKIHVADHQWYEAAARMAGFIGEREKAISFWEKLAELAPALMPAHRALARYYEEGESGAALTYLRKLLLRQPEHPLLLGLFAEWCEADEAAEAEMALSRGLEVSPNWAWAIRERALRLEILDRKEEAIQEARRAAELAVYDEGSWGILGSILWRAGEAVESEQCLLKALRLDIDYTWGIDFLIMVLRKRGAVEEGLSFLQEEIEKQVSTGEAVFSYRQHAYRLREPEDLMKELKGFCEQRPDLWQAWASVNDQALAMNDLEGAAEAAAELVKRFPLMPRAYSERAEVARAKGDYESEIKDLQKALEISPSWDFASRRLSEALERCERYDEALEVLEQASRVEPLNAANHGMAARLMALRGQKEKAFERMKQAVRVDSSYDYGWGELARWAEEMGRSEEVFDLVKEMDPVACYRPGWWENKRWVFHYFKKVEEALEVIEKGVKRFPQNSALRDELVMHLCRMGKYEEAMKECLPPKDGENWERSLAGRHAWVQMEAGYPREAIASTISIVKKDPDYAWAWRNLARWYDEREDWEECLKAAQQLIRLEPDDSAAWGYLGDSARKLEKTDEAEEAFEKAYLLDPEYVYGGRELLEIHVEKGNVEKAREIWTSLTHYTPSPFIIVDGITIELSAGKTEKATELLDELLNADLSKSVDPLRYAEWVFSKYELTSLWDERLSQKMKNNPSRPLVTAWTQACLERGSSWKALRRLKKLSVPFEVKAGAWTVFLEYFKNRNDRESSNKLIQKNWKNFQSDDETWTEGGYNLVHLGTTKEVTRWYANWRERGEGLSARDYLNIASAALRNGDQRGAREAVQRGLFQFRAGEFAESLRAMRRYLDELEGKDDDANQMVAISEPSAALPFYQNINQLANVIQLARENDFVESEREFKKVGEEWEQWLGDPVFTVYGELTANRLAELIPKYQGKSKKLRKVFGLKQGLFGKNEDNIIMILVGCITYIVILVVRFLNE